MAKKRNPVHPGEILLEVQRDYRAGAQVDAGFEAEAGQGDDTDEYHHPRY